MNLNELTSSDTFDVIILHPITGKKTDITITVYGADSKKYKNINHRTRNDKLRNMRRKETSENIEERSLKLLAGITKSWKNVKEDKKQIECNAKNALYVYEKFDFICEQVDKAVHDRENFLSHVPVS